MNQPILALFLPLTAVLYLSGEAENPKGTDTLILTMAGALKVLPIAARHSGQLYVSGSLSLLALGALAVCWAAIAPSASPAELPSDLPSDTRPDGRVGAALSFPGSATSHV